MILLFESFNELTVSLTSVIKLFNIFILNLKITHRPVCKSISCTVFSDRRARFLLFGKSIPDISVVSRLLTELVELSNSALKTSDFDTSFSTLLRFDSISLWSDNRWRIFFVSLSTFFISLPVSIK